MTPQEKAKQQAEVMLAYAAGMHVEVYAANDWHDSINPRWDWNACDYRVKKPALKVVKLQAWIDEFKYARYSSDPGFNAPKSWKRIPSLDLEYVEDES